jgi:hypothetical protein
VPTHALTLDARRCSPRPPGRHDAKPGQVKRAAAAGVAEMGRRTETTSAGTLRRVWICQDVTRATAHGTRQNSAALAA